LYKKVLLGTAAMGIGLGLFLKNPAPAFAETAQEKNTVSIGYDTDKYIWEPSQNKFVERPYSAKPVDSSVPLFAETAQEQPKISSEISTDTSNYLKEDKLVAFYNSFRTDSKNANPIKSFKEVLQVYGMNPLYDEAKNQLRYTLRAGNTSTEYLIYPSNDAIDDNGNPKEACNLSVNYKRDEYDKNIFSARIGEEWFSKIVDELEPGIMVKTAAIAEERHKLEEIAAQIIAEQNSLPSMLRLYKEDELRLSSTKPLKNLENALNDIFFGSDIVGIDGTVYSGARDGFLESVGHVFQDTFSLLTFGGYDRKEEKSAGSKKKTFNPIKKVIVDIGVEDIVNGMIGSGVRVVENSVLGVYNTARIPFNYVPFTKCLGDALQVGVNTIANVLPGGDGSKRVLRIGPVKEGLGAFPVVYNLFFTGGECNLEVEQNGKTIGVATVHNTKLRKGIETTGAIISWKYIYDKATEKPAPVEKIPDIPPPPF